MSKIFLADDDIDDTDIFKEALGSVTPHADVICSENGNILLKKLKNNTAPDPEYLFLDLNMPVKSGHECLQEIKAAPEFKDIRVVILTTSRLQKDIDSTYNNGADFYICKPTSMKEYETALKKLFSYNADKRVSREDFLIN